MSPPTTSPHPPAPRSPNNFQPVWLNSFIWSLSQIRILVTSPASLLPLRTMIIQLFWSKCNISSVRKKYILTVDIVAVSLFVTYRDILTNPTPPSVQKTYQETRVSFRQTVPGKHFTFIMALKIADMVFPKKLFTLNSLSRSLIPSKIMEGSK